MKLDEIRRFYAEEIEAVADLRTPELVSAFARVERERFLGPGPWQIFGYDGLSGRGRYRTTTDDDPRHLYHNVLVGIDPARGLNNGQPSALASWLDRLELRKGATVLHAGCGVGYYTAILAEMVGADGSVTALEVDAGQAARARENLRYLSQARVLHADISEYDPEPADCVLINAGVTHVQPAWLRCLRAGGRMMLPLTVGIPESEAGSGMMLLLERTGSGFEAGFVSPVSIYHCSGMRNETANASLRSLYQKGAWRAVRSLRNEPHAEEEACVLHGAMFCLSAREAGATTPQE